LGQQSAERHFPGEQFEPDWSQEELAAIGGVFKLGLVVLAAEPAPFAPDAAEEPGS
jgi:hypothetical protein